MALQDFSYSDKNSEHLKCPGCSCVSGIECGICETCSVKGGIKEIEARLFEIVKSIVLTESYHVHFTRDQVCELKSYCNQSLAPMTFGLWQFGLKNEDGVFKFVVDHPFRISNRQDNDAIKHIIGVSMFSHGVYEVLEPNLTNSVEYIIGSVDEQYLSFRVTVEDECPKLDLHRTISNPCSNNIADISWVLQQLLEIRKSKSSVTKQSSSSASLSNDPFEEATKEVQLHPDEIGDDTSETQVQPSSSVDDEQTAEDEKEVQKKRAVERDSKEVDLIGDLDTTVKSSSRSRTVERKSQKGLIVMKETDPTDHVMSQSNEGNGSDQNKESSVGEQGPSELRERVIVSNGSRKRPRDTSAPGWT